MTVTCLAFSGVIAEDGLDTQGLSVGPTAPIARQRKCSDCEPGRWRWCEPFRSHRRRDRPLPVRAMTTANLGSLANLYSAAP